MNNMPDSVKNRPCETEKALLITIDGPAGSGKTTVSRLLAKQLNYQYVDTGALYRCIAFEVNKAGISPTDNRQIQVFCQDLSIEFRNINGKSRIISNGIDLSDEIRTPEVTILASAVSAMPATTLPIANRTSPETITGLRPIRSDNQPKGICNIA